jgi:hypothetical protein
MSLAPGSILILITEDTPAMKWMEENDVPEALSHAGHKVYLVSSDEKLEEVLATTTVDIVIADLHDADRIRPMVARFNNAAVVPLIDKSLKSEIPRVADEYVAYLKAQTTESTFIGAVDIAIEDTRFSS